MSNKLGLCLMICFLLFVPALPAQMQDGDCGFYDMGCEPAGDNCGLFGCEPAENCGLFGCEPAENCGLFGCEPPEGENCGLFGCGSGSEDDMFGSMEAMNCQSFETILGSFSMLGPLLGDADIDFEGMLLPFGAELCLLQRDYSRALRLYERLKDLAEKRDKPIGVAMILNNMGAVYLAQSQYDEAYAAFQEAYVLFEQENYAEGQGVTLTNIGLAQTYQGRLVEAQENYKKGFEFLKEQDNTLWLAINRLNYGLSIHLQADLNDDPALNAATLDLALEAYKEAEIYYEDSKSDSALSSLFGAGLLSESTPSGSVDQDLLNTILPFFTMSNDPGAKLFAMILQGGNPAVEAALNNNMALIAIQQERYAEGRERLEKVLIVAQALQDVTLEMVVKTQIGFTYLLEGDATSALRLYNEAIEIGETSDNTDMLALALFNRGLANEALGNRDEAIADYETSTAYIELALNRATLDTTVSNLANMISYSPPYQRLAALYAVNGDLERALVTIEEGRAVVTRTQLLRGSFRTLTDTELISEEKELRTDLSAINTELSGLKLIGAKDSEIKGAQERLDKAQQAYNEHLEVMREQGVYTGREIGRYTSELSAIQAVVPDDTVLVMYEIGGTNPTDNPALNNPSLALLVQKTRIDVVPLTITDGDIKGLMETFRQSGQTDISSMAEIYRLVFAPIADQIPAGTQRLLIAADGTLNYVPFAALQAPDGHYLIDDYAISMIPSGTTLALLTARQNTPATQPILALAQPFAPGFSRLSNARTEATDIAGLFGVEANIDATEGDLRENVAGSGILHISAHAELNKFAPLSSVIYLKADDAYDGRLEVREIYELDLSATELVILSGCETGSGGDGEDFGIMNRAFFGAGAQKVVSSLWKVDDEATAFLLTTFMEERANTDNDADALRAAMLATRKQYPEPYYWASFVLTGVP